MNKKIVRILISLAVTLVAAAVYFYVSLPAINVYNEAFWVFLTMIGICFSVVYIFLESKFGDVGFKGGKFTQKLFSFFHCRF